jgi:hypothetical protein
MLLYAATAAGSETPSRTSLSHFFVKDAAKHPLVATAEGQIEALFGCPALRGPHKPLTKIEALQGMWRGFWVYVSCIASVL